MPGWGTGGEAWIWWRRLWAWEEEMLGECQALLHDFSLQAQSSDAWQWRPDPVRGYSAWELISF
ncbi:receptor-like kinase [Trifolium medium]|uniref:Receptor-like kinase n=1 Tax=Trifolium medium TaxID=97028 RepID=A0A392RG94_9FABA|nr:receptor-like kinase [Trifolium medium]